MLKPLHKHKPIFIDSEARILPDWQNQRSADTAKYDGAKCCRLATSGRHPDNKSHILGGDFTHSNNEINESQKISDFVLVSAGLLLHLSP